MPAAEPTLRMALHAMRARFELVLHGAAESRLRAAGEEAFEEIERLEAQLSYYSPTSEVSVLNERAAWEPVRVDPRLFALLRRAREVWKRTGGAFDVTVGPLLEAWGLSGEEGSVPDEETLSAARALAGMDKVFQDEESGTVQYAAVGVRLNLGAIGKGYAIERAALALQDAGIENALLHAGTSTVQALGVAPDGEPWRVAIEDPCEEGALLRSVALRDEALSVSAPHGRAFTAGGVTFGHVLDPRTGWPARGAALAAVRCASATESDALSTALLVLGAAGLESVVGSGGATGGLVLDGDGSGEKRLVTLGFEGSATRM